MFLLIDRTLTDDIYRVMSKITLRIFCLFLTLIFFISSSIAPVFAAITYLYDQNGNMTSDGIKCYEYNEANQVKKVKNCSNNQTIAEYVYDYQGNRLVKKTYSNGSLQKTTFSPNDGYETVKLASNSATQNTSYYFANDQLITKKNPDGTKNYYHNDHLGSTAILSNQSGGLVEETKYDPWGEVKAGGTKSKFLFTGQEKDLETNLNYYNARYYDSHIRRFTQPDDIIQNPFNPQSLNRYSYVLNNPLRYTDPTGHCIGPFTPFCGAIVSFVTKAFQPVMNLVTKITNNTGATKVVETANKVQSNPVTAKIENNAGKAVNNPVVNKVTSNIGNAASNIPKVTDQKLQNLINNNLYKGANNPNRIGSGSTADAIRNEFRTGQQTFGRWHETQGQENINAINNWLRKYPNASESDIKIANTIKDDITNALQGK